jgi:quinol monooxygenase YgiN
VSKGQVAQRPLRVPARAAAKLLEASAAALDHWHQTGVSAVLGRGAIPVEVRMISIVAKLRTVDGKADEFIAAAQEQIRAVQQHEAGKALMYTLQQSSTNPNEFVFYEQYADEAALAAHGTTDHMKAFGGKLRGVLDGRPEVERFTVVGAFD